MTAQRPAYEQARAAWIARQMQAAPPLGPRQQALIRSSFTFLRSQKASAA